MTHHHGQGQWTLLHLFTSHVYSPSPREEASRPFPDFQFPCGWAYHPLPDHSVSTQELHTQPWWVTSAFVHLVTSVPPVQKGLPFSTKLSTHSPHRPTCCCFPLMGHQLLAPIILGRTSTEEKKVIGDKLMDVEAASHSVAGACLSSLEPWERLGLLAKVATR